MSAILVFAGDHIVGFTYAYLWVRAVPSAPALPIMSDHIALELDLKRPESEDGIPITEVGLLRVYAIQMVDAEFLQNKGLLAGGLQASYGEILGVVKTESSRKIFKLTAVADSNNEACHIFFNFPMEEQQRWRARATIGLENGKDARCVAIVPETDLQAEYLLRTFSREGNLAEQAVGIDKISGTSISKISSGVVLVEFRSVSFGGGWVQRTFLTDLSSGRSVVIGITTPGPQSSIRPASRQRVL